MRSIDRITDDFQVACYFCRGVGWLWVYGWALSLEDCDWVSECPYCDGDGMDYSNGIVIGSDVAFYDPDWDPQ